MFGEMPGQSSACTACMSGKKMQETRETRREDLHPAVKHYLHEGEVWDSFSPCLKQFAL